MSITREIDVVAPNGDIKTYLSWKDRMLDVYITDFLFIKYLLSESFYNNYIKFFYFLQLIITIYINKFIIRTISE